MPCAFHCEHEHPFKDLGHGCQFGDETEFFRIDGREWCRFHLPMSDGDGEPSEKAGWGKDKINELNTAIFDWINKPKEKEETVNLAGVIFPGNISFKNFNSKDTAIPKITFLNSYFYGDASFNWAIFEGDACFEGVLFFKAALFGEALFSKFTFFSGSSFSKDVWFDGATFIFGAWFREVIFNGGAFFNGGISSRSENEKSYSNSFPRQMDFANAIFKNGVNFSNRTFMANTKFTGAVFEKVPLFHNSVLHQDTVFTESKFHDFRSENAARAYRTLKLAMEQHRAWDEAAMFYAFEQRSLRNQFLTPFGIKLFSFLYDVASGYGRSFIRPVFWLGVITGFSFLAYAIWVNAVGDASPSDAFVFTMQQIVRPFLVWTGAYVPSDGMKVLWGDSAFLLRIIASFQSLFSLGLITLFILAVRRRFKMG